MNTFTTKIHLRWADLDPNFHVRHSVYYDFGAQCRIELMNALGITTQVMQEQHLGPILFREECMFKREIRLDHQIEAHTTMVKMRPDGARWTLRHDFVGADNTLHAVITVDGAWLDTQLRKLVAAVPAVVLQALEAFPKAADFIVQ